MLVRGDVSHLRQAFFSLGMKTSHRGLMAIEAREGVILHAYRDSKGLWTIGCGHLIVPGDGFNSKSKITQQQSDDLFAQDIQKYENAVNRCVKVPLTQNQFDACVSFCLNIGTGGFCGSSVVKRINKGDIAGAGQAFMMWKKPPEIIGRRRSEQRQFLTPYPKVSVASPTIPKSGELIENATTYQQSPLEDATPEPPTPEGTPEGTVSVETKSTTIATSDGDSTTATTTTATAAEPITVKNVAIGLWTKVVAGITAVGALGINLGTVIETRLSEVSLNQVFIIALGVGLAIVVLFYIKSRQQSADLKTQLLIQAAASKEQNTVHLTK